jgi:hypothetical protein
MRRRFGYGMARPPHDPAVMTRKIGFIKANQRHVGRVKAHQTTPF